MTLKVVKLPEYIVVREIFPNGERAYRRWHCGTWDYSPDHKNWWFYAPEKDVPQRFKDAIDNT